MKVQFEQNKTGKGKFKYYFADVEYKAGVIKESGVGVFNGKVIVHEDAQKIEAFQKNNNILLDDESKI